MSIIDKLETEGANALTLVEHGAAWLAGKLITADVSLHTLEASSPLVQEAIAAGEASIAARGFPVETVLDVGEKILVAAGELAAGLSSPPPVPAASTVVGSAT